MDLGQLWPKRGRRHSYLSGVIDQPKVPIKGDRSLAGDQENKGEDGFRYANPQPMTLRGFTLAIGRLIDDSTVVLENINRHLAMGKPPRSTFERCSLLTMS
jgi:AcrB/AcrD/AcrF family